MSEDLRNRLDRVESLVERQAERIDDQQETIARQRERIGKLEEGQVPENGDAVLPPTTRRTALKAGGLLALLGVGAGTASADPQGQVGTGDDPIETLHAAAIEGPLTDGVRLDSLVGEGLAVRDGKLTNVVDVPALTISNVEVPSVHDEESFAVDVDVEETAGVRTDGLSVTLAVWTGGAQVLERTVEPAEIQGDTAAVTVGDGSPIGPLDTDEYTATVTADATNAQPATASESFTVMAQFAGGDGTSVNPYQIATWHHLDHVREVMDRALVLVGNLDPATEGYDAVASPSANGGNGFDPIGTVDTLFSGTFDGNGHTIDSLTIARGSRSEAGLFGVNSGVIENVALENADVLGEYRTASLVGLNDGGTVRASSATGTVANDKNRIGGLVADNAGDLSRCQTDVAVDSGGNTVGGLVGRNGGTVSDCVALGDASGSWSVSGLVADNYGTVRRSYALGSATGTGKNVSGLVGVNLGTIENAYATGEASGEENVGGLVGYLVQGGSVTDSYWDVDATDQDTSAGSPDENGLTTSEMQGAEAQTNMTAFDFSAVWATVDAENDADVSADDYPVLQALDRATQLEARA